MIYAQCVLGSYPALGRQLFNEVGLCVCSEHVLDLHPQLLLKWSVKGRGNEQDVSFAFVLQGRLPNECWGLFPVSVTHVLL